MKSQTCGEEIVFQCLHDFLEQLSWLVRAVARYKLTNKWMEMINKNATGITCCGRSYAAMHWTVHHRQCAHNFSVLLSFRSLYSSQSAIAGSFCCKIEHFFFARLVFCIEAFFPRSYLWSLLTRQHGQTDMSEAHSQHVRAYHETLHQKSATGLYKIYIASTPSSSHHNAVAWQKIANSDKCTCRVLETRETELWLVSSGYQVFFDFVQWTVSFYRHATCFG